MAVVPFAPLAATTMRERCDGSDRDALVGRLLDLSEAARLTGDQERADRNLLAAWAAYDDPGSLCGWTYLDSAQYNAAGPAISLRSCCAA
jgi:hypothetical protein